MKLKTLSTVALFFACGSFVATAQVADPAADHAADSAAHSHEASASTQFTKLICKLEPLEDSKVTGYVTFEKVADGVKVTAVVSGLDPGAKHGFHVHEFGDLGSKDGASAGGHFNPEGHDHALPDQDLRHAGDFGNLEADDDGKADYTITVHNITLDAGTNGILGRGVIVHAKTDDGGQPTGNAGDRIAAGVIGISKDSKTMIDGQEAPKKDS